MLRRHPTENRYCSHCRKTTPHEVAQDCNSYSCQRCGTEKHPTRRHKPVDGGQAGDSWPFQSQPSSTFFL